MRRTIVRWNSLLLFLTISLLSLQAQTITSVSGIIRDSITGEPIPYASIQFAESTIGEISDDEGFFMMKNDQGLYTIIISYLGYHNKTIVLDQNEKNHLLDIQLSPADFQLSEVVVRPKKQKYSRKNNPAVELVKMVIAKKDSNYITSADEYQTECYEKLSLALDNFDMDFDKSKLFKKFKFIQNYLDTSEFNGKPLLTLSLREKISDNYYQKKPKQTQTVIRAKRQTGVDSSIDDSGTISANLEEIFKEVNIFDNNINFLLNRFVSPLSTTMGTLYYHYYIIDTVEIGGEQCVNLSFVPASTRSYGFTGKLFITLDGTYSVKKVELNKPYHINLNYVESLRIVQEFKRLEDGGWALDTENTSIVFVMFENTQKVYARQLRSYDKYSTHIANKDSIFALPGSSYTPPSSVLAKEDQFWLKNRHTPLKRSEDMLEALLTQLKRVPVFNVFIKTIEILITGYIPIHEEKSLNKLDIGPMNTTFSSNPIEGFRIRAGLTTTANLHPQLFFTGYTAYGMNDRKWKYNGQLTYTFNKKTYHERESPINNLSLFHEYDLYSPGQEFLFTSKDNMFVAWKVGKAIRKMNYLRKTQLQYEKEWLNGMKMKTWIYAQNNEATGELKYILKKENDHFERLNSINTTVWGAQLRYAPGERAFDSRKGQTSRANLSKDAPIFFLTHQMGFDKLLGGQYNYHHTEASIQKRIWLSSFGHIDASLKAGKVWDKVPFPLLILPNTNQSLTIQPETFHLMNALEFVADQYVSFNATYYLKGWIFNRIPLINLLKLREVVSFSGIYGGLSDKNNPELSSNLFLLPEETYPLGKEPYMEFSVGVENILRILEVSYYRRLNYLNHPNIRKDGIRIALRFSF